MTKSKIHQNDAPPTAFRVRHSDGAPGETHATREAAVASVRTTYGPIVVDEQDALGRSLIWLLEPDSAGRAVASVTEVALPSRTGDPETLIDQPRRVLQAFERWLIETPGRSVVLSCDERGFVARLDERRESHGRTLTDAAAQSAQVVTFDGVRS